MTYNKYTIDTVRRCLAILGLCLWYANDSAAQILNTDFESWTFIPEAPTNTQKWTLDDWEHLGKTGQKREPLVLIGTYRDATAHSGNFALSLSRWYAYDFDMVRYKGECKEQPDYVEGYYKYTDPVLLNGMTDTAQISVYFTRHNSTMNRLDTVASGKMLLSRQIEYTKFRFSINYKSKDVAPDSVIINIQPSIFVYNRQCASGGTCSFLTIDHLGLGSGISSTNNISPLFNISPSPTSSNIIIEGPLMGKRIEIFDAFGQRHWAQLGNSDLERLELEALLPGIYWIKVGFWTRKILKI